MKKKKSNIPYNTTCCLGGFQEKSFSLIQEQTPANSVVIHELIFKRDRLLWSDETKKELFGSKHARWVWCTQGLKTRLPHVYNLIVITVKLL